MMANINENVSVPILSCRLMGRVGQQWTDYYPNYNFVTIFEKKIQIFVTKNKKKLASSVFAEENLW